MYRIIIDNESTTHPSGIDSAVTTSYPDGGGTTYTVVNVEAWLKRQQSRRDVEEKRRQLRGKGRQ